MNSVAGARGRNLAPNIAYIATLVTVSFSAFSSSSRVSLKSEKFEMEHGHLAPASEVAGGHTLPF
jgi:hypothetical protein